MAEDPRNRARQRDENRKGESSLIFDHFLERVHRRSSMGGTDIQRSLSVPLDKRYILKQPHHNYNHHHWIKSGSGPGIDSNLIHLP